MLEDASGRPRRTDTEYSPHSEDYTEHDTQYNHDTHTDYETGAVMGVNGEIYYEDHNNYDFNTDGFTSSGNNYNTHQNKVHLLSTAEGSSGLPDTSYSLLIASTDSAEPSYGSPPDGLSSGSGTAQGAAANDTRAVGRYPGDGAIAYFGGETTSSGNASGGLFTILGSRGANALQHVGKEMRVVATTDSNRTVHLAIANGSAPWSAGPSNPGYRRPLNGGGAAPHALPSGGGGATPANDPVTDGLGGLSDMPNGYDGDISDMATGAESPSAPAVNANPTTTPAPRPLANPSAADKQATLDLLAAIGAKSDADKPSWQLSPLEQFQRAHPGQTVFVDCLTGKPSLTMGRAGGSSNPLEGSILGSPGRVLQLGSGIVMVVGGFTGAALTAETGVGAVVSGLVGLKGIDNVQAAWSGGDTKVSQFVASAGGGKELQILADVFTDAPGAVASVAKAGAKGLVAGYATLADSAPLLGTRLMSGIDPADAAKAIKAMGEAAEDGAKATAKGLAETPTQAKLAGTSAVANAADNVIAPNIKPAFIGEANTPGQAFKNLQNELATNMSGASQADKITAFQDGVSAIRQHVGPFTVDNEFLASGIGGGALDYKVFVGGPGPKYTPVLAIGKNGEVYSGSLEASIGRTPSGQAVFNPFRANLLGK